MMERIRAASASLAIVSADSSFVENVVSLVGDEGTTVSAYGCHQALLEILRAAAPDVVLVDDRTPRDAADDIRHVRQRLPAVQVVYVNVFNERRVIDLLDWGADDAVVEGSAALAARLQAVARRARTLNAQNRIAIGDIIFDRECRRVWCAGREVDLTPHEFSVLDCLFWHAPKPVNFETLGTFVWGNGDGDERRSLVQVYVSYVRRKLSGSKVVTLRHAKAFGYAFVPKT